MDFGPPGFRVSVPVPSTVFAPSLPELVLNELVSGQRCSTVL